MKYVVYTLNYILQTPSITLRAASHTAPPHRPPSSTARRTQHIHRASRRATHTRCCKEFRDGIRRAADTAQLARLRRAHPALRRRRHSATSAAAKEHTIVVRTRLGKLVEFSGSAGTGKVIEAQL